MWNIVTQAYRILKHMNLIKINQKLELAILECEPSYIRSIKSIN